MEGPLLLLCAVLLAAVCVLAARLLRIQSQIRRFEAALHDVETGNGNRRMLAREGEATAPLAYAMNEIVVRYQRELAKLRRANEANRQLMTSLSHDVRTPLTTLMGYLDAAHRGMVSGEQREAYLGTARRKAHELKAYIDALFDWFKLGSGEYALSTRPVELAEMTRALLADWVPVLEEQGMGYTVDIPEARLMARVDPEGYARIVGNLMSNVLAHSRASEVCVRMTCDGGNIALRVEDDGIGIEKEALTHVFDRLYKCDKARAGKGSGLGLSIARGIAEAMGGTMKAESEAGKGTALTVTFSQMQG